MPGRLWGVRHQGWVEGWTGQSGGYTGNTGLPHLTLVNFVIVCHYICTSLFVAPLWLTWLTLTAGAALVLLLHVFVCVSVEVMCVHVALAVVKYSAGHVTLLK